MYKISKLENDIFSYAKRTGLAVIILTVLVFTLSALSGSTENEPQTPLEVATGWIALLWLLSIGYLVGIISVYYLLRRNANRADV